MGVKFNYMKMESKIKIHKRRKKIISRHVNVDVLGNVIWQHLRLWRTISCDQIEQVIYTLIDSTFSNRGNPLTFQILQLRVEPNAIEQVTAMQNTATACPYISNWISDVHNSLRLKRTEMKSPLLLPSGHLKSTPSPSRVPEELKPLSQRYTHIASVVKAFVAGQQCQQR